MAEFNRKADAFIKVSKLAAVFAMLFGLLTIFSGGSVLFGPDEAQRLAGNYIRFVVWFNFCAGGVYVIAAIGVWQRKEWAIWLAGFIAAATALAALGFAAVVWRGEMFEMRTVGALAFRFGFWVVLAYVARRAVRVT
jgi:hypothetical protein